MNYLARASDPEATAEELAALAERFPREVEANPAMPLIALEKPLLYAYALSMAALARWELALRPRLEEGGLRLWRLFSYDCAARALARYEELGAPDTGALRSALALIRRRNAGEYSDTPQQVRQLPTFDLSHPAPRALYEAHKAASPHEAMKVALAAVEAVGSTSARAQPSFWSGPPIDSLFWRARAPWFPVELQRVLDEIEWQRARLDFYLEGEGRKLARDRRRPRQNQEFVMLRGIADQAGSDRRFRVFLYLGVALLAYWLLR